MGRQMNGQAKNNRAPPSRWRGPKYILGHTDVLINDKHVFFVHFKAKNNDNSYFYKNYRLSFQWVPYYLNPYKPSVFFVGHRQTVQTQIRRHRTWRMIRVFTVCL